MMKLTLLRRISLALLAPMTLLTLMAAPALATTISFAPNPAAVQINDAFELKVLIADAADLYGFQFDVSFDPSLVQANEVLEGDFLTAGGGTFFLPGSIDNTAGTVTFTANTLVGSVPGVSGDGLLVRLLFQAIAAGQSELLFGNVVLLDSALAPLDFAATSGAIDVSAPAGVPEPASALLVGAGLAVLLAGARRRVGNSGRTR